MSEEIPSWVKSALEIDGLDWSEFSIPAFDGPCPECGREVDSCTHEEADGELPDRIACYDCWTILHGKPYDSEELLCRACGHFDIVLVHRLPK